MNKHTFTKLAAVILFTAILSSILIGCSKYNSSQAASSTVVAGDAVAIANFTFSPQTLNITAGTTVKWTNNDSTAHTITSDNGVFQSGNVAPGSSFSYTFGQTGTFSYHCSIHPSMTATIVVK